MEADVNTCIVCKRTLWHEHLGLRGEVLWTVSGDVAVCCASFDEDGNTYDGRCIDCCVPPAKRYTAFAPTYKRARSL